MATSSTTTTYLADPSSYSNVKDIILKNVHLNIQVLFKKQILYGHVDLTFHNINNTNIIILDTKLLIIHKIIKLKLLDNDIKDDDNNDTFNNRLEFNLGKHHDAFGSSLTINILKYSNEAFIKIRIYYETSPNASAIQWLEPDQTCGKIYPYLFTQCQAIHCRSMIPITDSPSNKFIYTASITVPKDLVALMSALRKGSLILDDERIVYKFEQPICIPAYLFALAVGKLESRWIGPRSLVWSEVEMVDAGAFEFSETEQFLESAEEICGPYVWGIYDILLLPPSFPYGGMENPCLTFVTPTLLAGDKSLAGVITHEISHSWMGNLVTCKNWQSMWLNEGMCVFLERKIYEKMYGKAYAGLKASIGYKNLIDMIDVFGEFNEYTKLCPNLIGVDPDDGLSLVQYEKGYLMLRFIEELVGESLINEYLKYHCEYFATKSVDCFEWSTWILSYFESKGVKLQIDWNELFFSKGYPRPSTLDKLLVINSTNLVNDWLNGVYDIDGMNNFVAEQKVLFLEKFTETFDKLDKIENQSLTKSKFNELMILLDNYYGFNSIRNSEIRFCWLLLCIRCGLYYVYPQVIDFLSTQGRMKFVRPLFRELNKSSGGKEIAYDLFSKLKSFYHPICVKMVSKDLNFNN